MVKKPVEAAVTDRRFFACFGILLMVFLTLGLGCRSAPETNGETRERPRRAAPEMPIPSPEELGDNPCGNPNWATLPREVGQLPEPDGDGDGEEIASDVDEDDTSER